MSALNDACVGSNSYSSSHESLICSTPSSSVVPVQGFDNEVALAQPVGAVAGFTQAFSPATKYYVHEIKDAILPTSFIPIQFFINLPGLYCVVSVLKNASAYIVCVRFDVRK